MSIAVVCPSRGNPEALSQAFESFDATKHHDETKFFLVVDEDDPKLPEYEKLGIIMMVVPSQESGNMNKALNWAAVRLAEGWDIIGFVGDDHRFRTPGWDSAVETVLRIKGGGMVYGDDLGQRERLPTAIFISAAIVRALGWMGLPGAKHLYLDNTWLTLGDSAGCLYYVPDFIIEHMHPAWGKGEWDEGHKRVNAADVYQHDAKVYSDWVNDGLAGSVALVRRALSHG